MTSCLKGRLCVPFFVGCILCLADTQSPAQPTANYRDSVSPELPKLCTPVSYRQGSSTLPIPTRITMLGDRYHEVNEALAGWNESGVPLVGRMNARWEPVPCADDTGLFYIVPLIARHTGWSADRSINVFLLGLVFASAVIGLVGLWLDAPLLWQRLLSIAPVLVGSWLSYKVGDVYVVQASLVTMLIPWFVYGLKPQMDGLRRLLIAFSGGILLGFGQWIRTQSASAPVVFFAVLLFASPLRRSMKLFLSAALLIGVGLPSFYAQLALQERDKFLVHHQSGYKQPLNHHVLWHTAYLGLAYLTNPYVSAWRDSAAVDYVESINPTAIYGGEEYENVLRHRVEEIVQRDHRFIFYTVAAKIGVLGGMLLIFINVGLAAAIKRPKPLALELAFWLAIAVAALPGIIAIPAPQYVVGMITLGLYYSYYSVSFYVGSRRRLHPGTNAAQRFVRQSPSVHRLGG
jgi:hypothetical protein